MCSQRRRKAKRGFKAGNAVGCAFKLDLFLVRGVGRVVGGDGVHHSVEDRLDHGVAVGCGAKRRIHLGIGIVKAHVLFREQEVVRSHFARNTQSVAASLAHGRNRGCRRCVGHMQMSTGVAQFGDETDVPLDEARFGFGWHAAQAKPECGRPCVHAGALREARVFGVLNDAEAHARRSGQGLAHHAVFEDGPAVVGDGDCACRLQRGKVIERLAL